MAKPKSITTLAKNIEMPKDKPVTTYSINKEIYTVNSVSEGQINTMIRNLDLGNFDDAVKILSKMRQDDRLTAVLNCRSFNLCDSKISVTAKLKALDNDCRIIEEELQNAEQEIRVWYETGLMLGASLLQIIYSEPENGKMPFKLQNYKPYGLRYDLKEDIYFLITSYKDQSEDIRNKRISELKSSNGYISLAEYKTNFDVEIITDNPKWILYQTGNKGFENGLIRPLAWTWYNKQLAQADLNNWSNKSAGPLLKLKVPAQSDPAANRAFAQAVKNSEKYGVIACPQTEEGPNYDVEYMEVGQSGTSYTAYENGIDRANASYAITVLSNNLSTEVQAGALASTEIHREKELMLAKSDKQYIEAIFQDQLLNSYAIVNEPRIIDAKISFETDQSSEIKSKLELITYVSDTYQKLLSMGYELQIDEIIGSIGVTDIIKKSENIVTEEDKVVSIALAPTDIAKIVRVREARASQGLPPFGDYRDDLSITEYDEMLKVKFQPKSEPAPTE